MDYLPKKVAAIGGSNEQQVYIAQRLPWKWYMYLKVHAELSHEITEFHPQTNQPDKKQQALTFSSLSLPQSHISPHVPV